MLPVGLSSFILTDRDGLVRLVRADQPNVRFSVSGASRQNNDGRNACGNDRDPAMWYRPLHKRPRSHYKRPTYVRGDETRHPMMRRAAIAMRGRPLFHLRAAPLLRSAPHYYDCVTGTQPRVSVTKLYICTPFFIMIRCGGHCLECLSGCVLVYQQIV